MRQATTAIAQAPLLPDWVPTSDINSVYQWHDDGTVLPYGVLRRQITRDREAAARFPGLIRQVSNCRRKHHAAGSAHRLFSVQAGVTALYLRRLQCSTNILRCTETRCKFYWTNF